MGAVLLFRLVLSGLALAVAAAAQSPPVPDAAAPVEGPPARIRLAGHAFGVSAAIEVHGLPVARAEAAGRAGFAELAAAEALLAPDGPLAALAAAAGRPVPLEPPLFELLERTLGFCLWSEGRLGPLGGALYARWGLRQAVVALPTPEALAAAVPTARCDNLRLDGAARTATLAAGSRLELWGFERGWAVDRAVERLRREGVGDARVVVGRVQRAFGPGPRGTGWPVEDFHFPGMAAPLSPVVLVDRALAAASLDDLALEIAGERFMPYLDLRTGRPAKGVVAALAAAELAVDAQALATAMAVAGSTQGQFLLGSIRPAPPVLWLLGSGSGEPLFEGSHWSELRPR